MGLQLPPRVRRLGPWTAVSAGLLLLAGCAAEDRAQIRRLAMPTPATNRAPAIYDLWQGAWLAAILVGILVWGLIIYACFAFRRRRHDETSRSPLSISALSDQAGVFEDLEVSRNARLRHVERSGQLRHGGRSGCEPRENRATRGIGQSGEHKVQVSRFVHSNVAI